MSWHRRSGAEIKKNYSEAAQSMHIGGQQQQPNSAEGFFGRHVTASHCDPYASAACLRTEHLSRWLYCFLTTLPVAVALAARRAVGGPRAARARRRHRLGR